ncbi:MAG: uroporphyrinogen-III synthase [Candidatus Acidiferrales bacterium]
MGKTSQGQKNRTLAGKRIVVTRAPEQARDWIAALERRGAMVLLLPMVRFEPPETWEAVDAAIRRLAEFDWALFTSANAVRFFSQRCRELEAERELFQSSRVRVGAVGPATAETLTQEGWRVDYVASVHTGEALARELASSLAAKKVLLPRSDRGDGWLPNVLREAGAEVTEVIAYRTANPEGLDSEILGRLRRAEVDAVVFASPSAFRNLCDAVPAAELATLSGGVPFAAIGPATARALREGGVRPQIEASDSSAEALADAIARYFERPVSTVRTA